MALTISNLQHWRILKPSYPFASTRSVKGILLRWCAPDRIGATNGESFGSVKWVLSLMRLSLSSSIYHYTSLASIVKPKPNASRAPYHQYTFERSIWSDCDE